MSIGDIDQPARSQRLLGLFAHPDDEVFCVGGTFAQAALKGVATKVVSFTKGEAGSIRHAQIATRATLASVRADELSQACRELGVQESACLNYVDGDLESTNRTEVVRTAVQAIRAFRPTHVYSFDHTGAYGHPDHIAMSQVSLQACTLAGDSTAFPDAGPAFSPIELLHARFPQNDRLLLRLLVDWLNGLDNRFRGTEEFMNALLMFADGTSMLGYASDHLCIEWFPTGSFIIEQGAPASSLYLVLSGAVDVLVESAGSTTTVGSVGVGEFLGEVGIASDQDRNAHCVATENTACFVLSPGKRSQHAPRGPDSGSGNRIVADRAEPLPVDMTVDVADQVRRKVCALARHRSQYSITPELFPDSMLNELLGVEYFFRAWTSEQGSL